MRILATIFSVCIFFILMPDRISYGQTATEINGYIRDEYGVALSGTKVRIENLLTNISRSVECNEQGFYRLIQLPPGPYQILVTANGFSKYLNREIVLEVRQILNINITLRSVKVGEDPQDTSILPLFNVTENEVSQIISLHQIEKLPINGRRFVDFALLTPNVAFSRDGRASNNQIAEGGLRFGGTRSWMNNFMIDGIESNNLYNGAIVNSVSQEAVREFQVLAGNHGADLGRTAGGVVNIVTKSGTNDFHGNIYYFLRHDALDARPGLARKDEDHFRQNQFGLTLGGPIQRNNVFFFINYEGQRKSKQVGFSSAFIQNLDRINRRKADFGLPSEDPSIVPSDDYDTFLIRVDQKLNDHINTNLRYSTFDENTKYQYVGGSVLPSAGENASIRNQTFTGTLTAFLTGDFVSELRGGYSLRSRNKMSSSGFETGVKGTALLLVDVGAMGHLQTNIPAQREEQIEIANNYSHFRGDHYIKFGVGFNLIDSEAVLAYFDPPNFRTNLAGFLASPPVFGLIIAQEDRTSVKVNVNALSWFIQDSWRVTSNLNLNYGIRYDVENINASNWSPKTAERPQVAEPDKNNFQPRVGIAYSMVDGRIVIRSAFGIFHDKRVTQNSLYELTFNPVVGAARVFSPIANLTDAFLQYISGMRPLASQFGPLTAQGIDINSFVNPYSIQWSLGIEHSLKKDLVIAIQYLGTRGVHLISQVNGEKTNIAPWDGITQSLNGLPDYRFRLINPRIAQYRSVASEGNSVYHGLALIVNKRFVHNLSFGANYTFSKTIDDSTHLSSSSSPQDPYRRDLERALSNNDVRHRFTFNFIADAPKSFPRILQHFSISTITTLESGRPYSFRAGMDLNHDFINTTDRVGSSGRNVFTGPSFASVDMRISRIINLSEKLRLEIIAEAFNLFNRFNVQEINDVYGRATFDLPPLETFKTPTSALDPRDIQLGVKFRF